MSTGLEDLWGLLTSPFRAFSDIRDSVTGKAVEEALFVSEEQMAALEQQMAAAGFLEPQRERVRDLWRNKADYGTLLNQFDTFDRENRAGIITAEGEAIRQKGMQTAMGELGLGIGAAETRMGDIGKQIGEYGTMLKVPGMVRSSAEFGNALAGAEAYINAAAENQRRTAAAQTAGSGLRASGGAADIARSAELNAADQKAGVFGSIMEKVSGKKTALEQYKDQLQQYRDSLGAQKGALAQDDLGTYMGLQQFKLGAMPTFDYQEAVTEPRVGLAQYQTGQNDKWLQQLIGMGQRGVDSVLNTGTTLTGQLGSMFGKGG